MPISWSDIFEKLEFDLSDLIADLIIILFTCLFTALLLNIIRKITGRISSNVIDKYDRNRSKAIVTSMSMLNSVSKALLYFLAFAIIVNRLGFGAALTNMITAAGIGVLVISMGAQSAINDLISGAFILFEKQYGVGDYIKVNDFTGTVKELSMRCTYLDSWTGEQIAIPNGQIRTIINYSTESNLAIVDVQFPYKVDAERARCILQEVADEYYEKHPDICCEKPTVVGINSFDENAYSMAIYQKAVGRNHFAIQRDLRLAVKKRFEIEKLSYPYTRIVVEQKS